jgi:hypothetical protein
MKKAILLLSVGLIFIALFTGCDERKSVTVPTDPQSVNHKDAKTVLAFQLDDNLSKSDYYSIALYNTSTTGQIALDDSVALVLGDSVFTMNYHSYPPLASGWFTNRSHKLTGTEHITLYVNNHSIMSTNITAINKASVAFPAHYNYQESLTMNWATGTTNTYQFVKVEAWDAGLEGSTEPFSEYVKQIAANKASYTFPANAVSLGTHTLLETFFVLGVEEVNYKIVKNTAVMVYQNESFSYSNNNIKKPTESNIKHNILSIQRILSGR